jgi:hypothetical protein
MIVGKERERRRTIINTPHVVIRWTWWLWPASQSRLFYLSLQYEFIHSSSNDDVVERERERERSQVLVRAAFCGGGGKLFVVVRGFTHMTVIVTFRSPQTSSTTIVSVRLYSINSARSFGMRPIPRTINLPSRKTIAGVATKVVANRATLEKNHFTTLIGDTGRCCHKTDR